MNPSHIPSQMPSFHCIEGEFKLADGSCTPDYDACNVCAELGLVCEGKGADPKFCVDCDCGFCGVLRNDDLADDACCQM